MRLKILLLLFAVWGAILPFSADASDPSSISVNMTPENPAPGDSVTITLSSYASNLDSVSISWSVNGKTALSGIGKESFSVTAPGAGSETSVIATVNLPDGSIDKRILIRPAVMVLLWQADDSYVPPFYRGKALPSAGSAIRVVAIPEVKTGSQILNPGNMVYAWKQDYTNKQDGSGYGKNSFTYTNDYLDNSNNIDVTASTVDGNYSSEANIDMITYQPKIEFYKNDAALGTLWEQALPDGYKIKGSEIIFAAPYFISPEDIRIPSLTFSWFINDAEVAVSALKKNLFPIQAPAGTSGTSQIRLEINSSDKIFETSSRSINVNF